MSRGYYDFGVNVASVSQTGVDAYELGTRLYGIVSLVRTGKVFAYNQFSDDTELGDWRNVLPREVFISTSKSYQGGSCLEIARVDTDLRLAGFMRVLPALPSPRIGVEFYYSFEYVAGKSFCWVYVYLLAWYNGYKSTYTVGISPTNKMVGINATWTNEGSMTSVHSFGSGEFSGLYVDEFHQIKLVVDVNTCSYVRLYADGYGYNVGMYNAYSKTQSDRVPCALGIFVPKSPDLLRVWIDSLSCTYDEP